MNKNIREKMSELRRSNETREYTVLFFDDRALFAQKKHMRETIDSSNISDNFWFWNTGILEYEYHPISQQQNTRASTLAVYHNIWSAVDEIGLAGYHRLTLRQTRLLLFLAGS